MKKKIFSIVLLVVLLLGSLIMLTGCGESGDEEEDSSPEAVVEDAVKAIEKMDYDELMECVDLKGLFVAYDNSIYDEDDMEDFEELYEDLGASEWKREKEYIEEELEEEFNYIKEEAEEYDDFKLKIDKINSKKISGTKIYKVEIEVTGIIKYDGQTDEENGEFTVYVWKNDGDYKIITAEDF